uniref:40S ribosomal protein S6 n=1 Tax=Loxodonta africana TaxID=9785 RepID=G3UJY8_LOXAF
VKLNVSFPVTGFQKLIEVDNERRLRTFYGKWMATEVAADSLGDERKGYVVRTNDGNHKQGFPKQGVLSHDHVHLLRRQGCSCYRPKTAGARRCKSAQVAWMLIKWKKDIPRLADTTVSRHGPKRASRIHEIFSLSKKDDVHPYVLRKPLNKEGKKPRTKAPKIQHLVTPHVLQHKGQCIALKKQRTKGNKEEAAEYAQLLAKRMKEAKGKLQEQIAKSWELSLRASSSESSQK